MSVYSSANVQNKLVFANNARVDQACVIGKDYTMMGWLYLTTLTGANVWYGLLGSYPTASTVGTGWEVWCEQAGKGPVFSLTQGANFSFPYQSASMLANKWLHWTVTYRYVSATSAVVEIFYNGTRVSRYITAGPTPDNPPIINTATGNVIIIGGNGDNPGPIGKQSHIRIFRKVLSLNEIRQCMFSKSVPQGPDASCILDAPLTKTGTNLVAYDLSNNGAIGAAPSTFASGTYTWADDPPVSGSFTPLVNTARVIDVTGAFGVTSSQMEVTTWLGIIGTAQYPVNLVSDTIKVALFPNTISVPNFSSDTAYGVGPFSTANEVTGAGYTVGGVTLTNKQLVESPAGTIKFTADDAVWSSATVTARAALIYDASVSNRAICLLNFGGDYSTSNATFTLHWSTAGIFTLQID